jgi:antitoxin MazE
VYMQYEYTKQRGLVTSKAVKSGIVKMGNSKGIRITEPILEQLALGKKVEPSVRGDRLVIRPGKRPRNDWEERFERMAAHGDDHLLDEEALSLTASDKDDWQWK